MATWSRVQIEVMARGEGWGKRSKDISHVAMAESAGNDKVVNSIGCVGLLQINQPVHVKAHPTWTRSWLQNPGNNLKAGLALYKAAGNKLDGPWLDSRDKGSGGGWGSKVSGGSGGTDASQAGDGGMTREEAEKACELVPPSVKDRCIAANMGNPERGPLGGDSPLDGIGEVAGQLGRMAQAIAKAGNWLAEPKNWVRIAYVTGGGLLALTAVAVIVRPYSMTAYRQVTAALPVKTTKKLVSRARGSGSEGTTP